MKKVYYEFHVIMRNGYQAFVQIQAESIENAKEKIKRKYKIDNADILSLVKAFESEG